VPRTVNRGEVEIAVPLVLLELVTLTGTPRAPVRDTLGRRPAPSHMSLTEKVRLGDWPPRVPQQGEERTAAFVLAAGAAGRIVHQLRNSRKRNGRSRRERKARLAPFSVSFPFLSPSPGPYRGAGSRNELGHENPEIAFLIIVWALDFMHVYCSGARRRCQ